MVKISVLLVHRGAQGAKSRTAGDAVPCADPCDSPAVETVLVQGDRTVKIREQGPLHEHLLITSPGDTWDYLWPSPLPQHLQFWDKKHAPGSPPPLQLRWKLALFEIQGVFTVHRNNPNVERDLLLTVNPLSLRKTRVNAGNKLPFIYHRDNASLSLIL